MAAAVLREPDPAGLAHAAAVLRGSGLVAFPTETVYGLGADAFDVDAVARIYEVKGRPTDNPTIVHVAEAAAIERVVARVTPLARRLIERFVPGPLTLVMEAGPDVPAVTTGGLTTVAVRVPDHPVAAELLRLAGRPVAAPSANRSGRPSPTTASHVLADLGEDVDVILDGGPCAVGVESTVVDARGIDPVVLREGSITRELLGVAGSGEAADGASRASPGTRYRHYAPSCRVELAPAGGGAARALALRDEGQRVGLISSGAAPSGVVEVVRFTDAVDLAKQLYAALRAAEAAYVDAVVVEEVEPVGLGRAVMDRLQRAAAAGAER